MDRMRIVALFDLPANIFAETGVNTSLIVAYKPGDSELARLKRDGYSIFIRDIQRVGYEKRTRQRNVFFNPLYRFDETTFAVLIDSEGHPVLDEEFTETIEAFQTWILRQESTLRKIFLEGS